MYTYQLISPGVIEVWFPPDLMGDLQFFLHKTGVLKSLEISE